MCFYVCSTTRTSWRDARTSPSLLFISMESGVRAFGLWPLISALRKRDGRHVRRSCATADRLRTWCISMRKGTYSQCICLQSRVFWSCRKALRLLVQVVPLAMTYYNCTMLANPLFTPFRLPRPFTPRRCSMPHHDPAQNCVRAIDFRKRHIFQSHCRPVILRSRITRPRPRNRRFRLDTALPDLQKPSSASYCTEKPPNYTRATPKAFAL
jgi:hypothetical protein